MTALVPTLLLPLLLLHPSPSPYKVLVNCAGTSESGAFDALPIESFERMLSINFLGSVYPTRVVLPEMKHRRSGSIVFVSSQAGQVGISSSSFSRRREEEEEEW